VDSENDLKRDWAARVVVFEGADDPNSPSDNANEMSLISSKKATAKAVTLIKMLYLVFCFINIRYD
jgi:hypothetical protein